LELAMRILIVFLMIGCQVGLAGVTGSASRERSTKANAFWLKLWTQKSERNMFTERSPEVDWKYSERIEIDAQSARLMSKIEDRHQLLFDPYLEDYVTQLLHKVASASPIPGRPGTLTIRLLKSAEPNAFALNDGTILVYTGMLSLVRTENELLGVLAHEVAHVVLDHNLQNYDAKKSVEALVSFIGPVGPTQGAALPANGTFGRSAAEIAAIGATTGLMLPSVASAAMDVVGASYSHAQEVEADLAAVAYLKAMGLNHEEYGDLLFRLGSQSKLEGSSQSAPSPNGPTSTTERLEEIGYVKGKVLEKHDQKYERSVVDILTLDAAYAINMARYEQAAITLDRVIQSDWVTEEVYFLKALTLRHLSSDPQVTSEALGILDTASVRDASEIRWVNSEKGILYLRMGDTAKALSAFEKYLADLLKLDPATVGEELVWAKRMVAKCRMVK
jgi:beta-barrel assembly-enhancing protease